MSKITDPMYNRHTIHICTNAHTHARMLAHQQMGSDYKIYQQLIISLSVWNAWSALVLFLLCFIWYYFIRSFIRPFDFFWMFNVLILWIHLQAHTYILYHLVTNIAVTLHIRMYLYTQCAYTSFVQDNTAKWTSNQN